MAVDQVRLVQCDAALASDTLIDPSSLAHVRASGFGGSDFTPAFEHLAHDPRVRAVLVITDGDITIPAVTPMFEVLWLITSGHGGFGSSSFHPPFGRVVKMERT